MKECQLCKNCFADSVVACPNDGMPTVHTVGGEPVLEGKYQLECRLGQGGMGVVYKARHAYLKTQLAIKVILPDLVGNDPQLVTRFRQEALAAAAIRHQNVVSVTDYGVIDGTVPFLVMEYVEGESLHDMLAREKKLAPEKAFELMSAVCAGVGAAHHQGIVHRDLKPLNVMICSDKPSLSQAVKILDFGLAKIKSGELLGSFIQAQTTGLMGSPYYMAPEQWADEEPDSRSDIYSLGVMLFQLLAGDVPFKGSSIPAIMKKHISDPAPTLADVGLSVSPELELAVQHALKKDKNQRTATVEALVEELRQAIYPGAVSINPTTGLSFSDSGFSSTSSSLPVSSLKITSRPPKSSVFVDNVAVGQTADSGSLLLDGIQSGNHHLRISHDGFQDWLGELVCDGKPQEVVIELTQGLANSRTAIPRPDISVSGVYRTQGVIPQGTVEIQDDMAQTVHQNWKPERFDVSVSTIPPPPKKTTSPVLLGIGGLLALFVVIAVGGGAAYYFGAFGGKVTPPGNIANSATPIPGATPVAAYIKGEMVKIPGGTFKMGRNAQTNEYPEHVVSVNDFAIGKTEVTNAEYLEFVKGKPWVAPKGWREGEPLPGTEMKPVTFVSQDDAKAYASWLSARDGATYRLPTEEEWEYAARNGAKSNRYPWGDDWVDDIGVMGTIDGDPVNVGTKPSGANMWGVLDLMGNVWEWTGSELKGYPGSEGLVTIKKMPGIRIVLRGGSAFDDPVKTKITATFRVDVPSEQKEKIIGFRLVRAGG